MTAYPALEGWNRSAENRDGSVANAVRYPGPVLVRVQTDYGDRKVRWIEAVRGRFAADLSAAQKVRIVGRIAGRSITPQASD